MLIFNWLKAFISNWINLVDRDGLLTHYRLTRVVFFEYFVNGLKFVHGIFHLNFESEKGRSRLKGPNQVSIRLMHNNEAGACDHVWQLSMCYHLPECIIYIVDHLLSWSWSSFTDDIPHTVTICIFYNSWHTTNSCDFYIL